MEFLPDEVLCNIFNFCEEYHYSLSKVCLGWAQILFGDLDEQRNNFIEACIRDGSEIAKKFPLCLFTSKRIQVAILNNRIEILELVKEQISLFECSRTAGQAGNIPMIEWLIANVGRPYNAITIGAAKGGQLATLKWLRKKGFVLLPGVMTAAAESGSLETFQWLEKKGCPLEVEICDMAARSGCLKLLQRTRELNSPWREKTSLEAFRSGNLEMVKWMKEQECPWHPNNCLKAAQYGHLKLVKWELQENGGKWTQEICKEVARFGGLEILKWARSQKKRIWKANYDTDDVMWVISTNPQKIENWESEIVDSAIEGNQLEVLRWAVKGGAQLKEEHLILAAEKGHLKIVQWIIGQKQPWHPNTLRSVKDWKVYKWAIENGCPEPEIRLRSWKFV